MSGEGGGTRAGEPGVPDGLVAQIRETGIRGRVAMAMVVIERALALHDVRDERVAELADVVWRFVEHDGYLDEVDEAWRHTRVAEDGMFDVMEQHAPLPVEYAQIPRFVFHALDDAIWIALSQMYGSIEGYGEESVDLTVRVLRTCVAQGAALPDVGRFSRFRFDEQHGWGRPAPRSLFAGR